MKNIILDRRGFTLIELLVVVLIIGILSSVALPQYRKAVEKARSVEILSAVNAMSKTAQMYFLSGNTAEIGIEDLEVELGGCTYVNEDCYTKYAKYWFKCREGKWCSLETYRQDGCSTGSGDCNWTNAWSINRVWNSGKITRNDCITQLTDTGKNICKSLESQGYSYYEGEM